MAVRSIVALTISAILIIVFVSNPDDILIYALIAIMVTVITTISNLYYVRRFISFKKTAPYNLKQYFKPLLVLCTLSLTLSLYNQTDTFILGFINSDKTEVASYSVGIKGIDVIIGIITALSVVFIPRAAHYYNLEDKQYFNRLNKYSINICLFIVMPAIITMCVLAKPICGLISGTYDFTYGNGYWSAPYILMILASMMLTYSIGDIIYGQILLPMKKEKYYLLAIGVGTVLNVALSIILGGFVFKDRPAIGVAIGTASTDLLIIIFLMSISWKWIKKAIFNKNSLKLLIGNAIILGISLLVYNPLMKLWSVLNISISVSYVLQLLSVLLIDAIIYLVTLLLLKEDLVYSFIRKRKENIDA